MKKILSLVLILAMALGVLAGCGNNDATTTTADPAVGLQSAKEYLYAMYKDNDGTIARKGFSLVASVRIDGVSYPIEWTANTDQVTITPDGSYVKVEFDTAPVEQLNFTLTATIKGADGKTATVQISRFVEAKKASGVTIADAPVAGTAYKLTVAQNEETVNQTLYFTGNMSGFYLESTTNPFEAVDVIVEETTGGYYLYFLNGETKTYIDIVERDGEENKGKVNIKLVETPSCVFTWNTEFKTFVTSVAGGDWYLGCYKTYTTISASSTSYINADNADVSQFPVRLATVNIEPTVATEPKEDTVYKLHVAQNEETVGKNLYFTGKMSGYYLETTTNPGKAVNIRVESTTGGYYLYFLNGETKTYIDIIEREGEENKGKVNIKLVETPSCVFTWNADFKTFITSVAGGEWYLGCYKTYTTISASSTSYINADNVDVSQFPARLATVEGFMDEVELEAPCEHVEEVIEGKAATCTEDGLTEGKKCSVCGEILTAQQTVKATGHSFGEWTVVTPATTEVEGEESRSCTACGEKETRVIEKIQINEPNGHVWDEGVVTEEATEEKEGVMTFTCTICGATKTEAIPVIEVGDLTELKNGDKVIVYAPAYNIALSSDKTGYYNKGVDVSAGFDGMTDAEIWIVTVNDDGSYSFVSGTGKKLALAAEYSSLNEEGANDTWTVTAKEGAEGVFYVKNIGRGNSLEWYAEKSNWSSYNTSSYTKEFEISFRKAS